MERHVILSAMDNVQGLVEWLEVHKASDNAVLDIKPLDDGGIVPHYSGKGRGGEYALSLIHNIQDGWNHHPQPELLISPWLNAMNPTPSIIPGLTATIINTLPFLHTNFALSTCPLPTTEEGRTTQWSISACLGDSSKPLDMFSLSDLKYIVPAIPRAREVPRASYQAQRGENHIGRRGLPIFRPIRQGCYLLSFDSQ